MQITTFSERRSTPCEKSAIKISDTWQKCDQSELIMIHNNERI